MYPFFKDDTYQTCSERLAAENMYCLYMSLINYSRVHVDSMLIALFIFAGAYLGFRLLVAPLRSQNEVAFHAFSFLFAWTMDVLFQVHRYLDAPVSPSCIYK